MTRGGRLSGVARGAPAPDLSPVWLLRELEKIDLIEESDKRLAADEDDERRRYFALTPHGKRVLDAEVRRLEAIVHQARSSRALRKAFRA